MTAAPHVAPGTAEDPSAPASDGVLAAPHREPTRLVDAALGAVVLWSFVPPGAPSSLSVGLTAMAVLVLVGTTRPPTLRLSGMPHRLGWLVPVLLATFVWLVLVTLSSPDESLYGWEKRALRLVLVTAFLLSLVTGRVHYPSVVRGAAAGLVGNAFLFFAGLAPANYGALLSGYLMDKNQAGLSYTVVGLLYAGLQDRPGRRALVLAATGALVWTTGSRTSLAALVCGAAWLVLAPHLGRLWRLVLAGGLAAFVEIAERQYARVGVFADRYGSDVLRERIDAASWLKTEASPPWGRGLGEAFVHLEERVFLFHNSYWAALLEGGWVLVGVYVGLTALAGVGIARRARPSPTWVGVQAANIAVLVCALRLGEVFGTGTSMLALAGGLLALMALRSGAAAEPSRRTSARAPAVESRSAGSTDGVATARR